MLNLKQKLSCLITKLKIAVVMHQLAAVDARQRDLVSNVTFAGLMRLSAQEHFAKGSTINAAAKRRLLARFDYLMEQLPDYPASVGVETADRPAGPFDPTVADAELNKTLV